MTWSRRVCRSARTSATTTCGFELRAFRVVRRISACWKPAARNSWRNARPSFAIAVAGALLTALGCWLGDKAWGWVVLVAFVVTLLASLAVKYGAYRFAAALLLNIWSLIALSPPAAYEADHVQSTAWAQALAWLIGAALMIGYIGVMWLATGRSGQQTGAELLPADTTPVPLTRPVIMYAVLRALTVAITVAIPFGLNLPNADWMPIAALVAVLDGGLIQILQPVPAPPACFTPRPSVGSRELGRSAPRLAPRSRRPQAAAVE